MNSCVLIGILLVTCHLALASKKDVSSIFLFSSNNNNNCQSTGLQCKDCETIQYCNSEQESVFQIRCSDQSKSNKFCDTETNSCVKDQPAVCNLDESSFECPGEGMYPDLENCNNYYVCDENKVGTNYACSTGFIYNHTTKGCTPASYCKSYSSKTGQCKGKTNKLVAYAPSKDLYLLCLSGKHPLLFQCPIPGDSFNEDEVTCKFECSKSGYFTYQPDSSKFYSCEQVGKKFTVNLLDCPVGTEFVDLGEGYGICTTKSTTTSTTEGQTTVVEDVEGSGEAPEEVVQEDVQQEDVQQEDVKQEEVLIHVGAQFEETLATNEDLSNNSPVASAESVEVESAQSVEVESAQSVEVESAQSVETVEK